MRTALLLDSDSPHIGNYLDALGRARGVSALAIVDAGAAIATADGRWKRFATAQALLREFKPDLAVVTYPAVRTPPAVMAALESGAHVIVEKPACIRPAEFAPLVRLADTKHKFLMLALANRAHPLLKRARSLVREGAVGRPYAAHVHFVADQARLKTAAYQKSWFNFRNQTMGGFLAWLSIHYLDMMQYLTGDRFQSISAITRNANRLPIEVEDSVAAAFTTSGGVVGSLQGGYYLDRGYQSGFQMWGSEGWIRFAMHTRPPEGVPRVLEWFRYGGESARSESFDDIAGAYPLFVQETIDAITLNKAPLMTPGESLHLLETLDAAYRSAAGGILQQV